MEPPLMMDLNSATMFWPITALQVLGMASAAMARVAEGSRRQSACQNLFFACLVLIGLATIVAIGLGLGCWLSCGVVLSVMSVAATWDFGRSERAGAWEW
jgi:hypothetical protein